MSTEWMKKDYIQDIKTWEEPNLGDKDFQWRIIDSSWKKSDELIKSFDKDFQWRTIEYVKEKKLSLRPNVHDAFLIAFDWYFEKVEKILDDNKNEAENPRVKFVADLETTKLWYKFLRDTVRVDVETGKGIIMASNHQKIKIKDMWDLDEATS